MLVAALLVMGIAPATADAAPTVTATGDAGTPITLSPSAPTGIRQMDVSVGITVADDTFFQAQVLDGGGGAATPLSDCEDPGASRARRPTTATARTPSWSSTSATRTAAR